MPWIGLSAILLTCRVRPGEQRLFATLAILIATMSVPFIWLSWHGGGSGNMRYFLPILPPLCILCARLFHDLWLVTPQARISAGIGMSITLALGATWIAKNTDTICGQMPSEYSSQNVPASSRPMANRATASLPV